MLKIKKMDSQRGYAYTYLGSAAHSRHLVHKLAHLLQNGSYGEWLVHDCVGS
jgi:hypothetical protein